MKRLLLAVLVCAGCESRAPETARDSLTVMIQQVRQDSADEAGYQADSTAILSTFATKAVDHTVRLTASYEDDDGNMQSYGRFFLWASDQTVCEVDTVRFAITRDSSLVRCQWETKISVEGPAE